MSRENVSISISDPKLNVSSRLGVEKIHKGLRLRLLSD